MLCLSCYCVIVLLLSVLLCYTFVTFCPTSLWLCLVLFCLFVYVSLCACLACVLLLVLLLCLVCCLVCPSVCWMVIPVRVMLSIIFCCVISLNSLLLFCNHLLQRHCACACAVLVC